MSPEKAAAYATVKHWVDEITRLYNARPRLVAKVYRNGGAGPTDEQAAAYFAANKPWRSAYAKARAERKKAVRVEAQTQ